MPTLAATSLSKELFKVCSKLIPSSTEIARAAIEDALLPYGGDQSAIKNNFSLLISEVQVDAYRRYQEAESAAAGEAIKQVLRPMVEGETADDAFDFLASSFKALDQFSLSLTQSRRSRAGTAFEVIMSRLLDILEYPYTPQPKLVGSNPDYVMPSIEWYDSFAADCIILTCKRTLRERWRQIVTEGSTGTSFFLATIDDRISQPELGNMKARNVIVVVPATTKLRVYSTNPNVISFENFFQHHLDPAMLRWSSTGAI